MGEQTEETEMTITVGVEVDMAMDPGVTMAVTMDVCIPHHLLLIGSLWKE